MTLSKKDAIEMSTRVYGLLTNGQTDLEIMDELGLTTDEYQIVKNAMFDVKAEELRTKSREHTYVEYLIEQRSNISALKEMIADFRLSNQHNALVGAIRLRSDLLDRIVKTGQEMGFIQKEVDQTQIIMGIAVAELTNKDLKKGITAVVSEVKQLTEAYGMDQDFLDVPAGETHRGEKLADESKSEKE